MRDYDFVEFCEDFGFDPTDEELFEINYRKYNEYLITGINPVD